MIVPPLGGTFRPQVREIPSPSEARIRANCSSCKYVCGLSRRPVGPMRILARAARSCYGACSGTSLGADDRVAPQLVPSSAFVSYSWDDDNHKHWVHELAVRLRQDGVDVTLDSWSAAPGDQLPHFMERSIRENNFVVIVCTPRYKERSESRIGGVGYEGDIMTSEVMQTQNHRKFIPVLRRGTWSEAAPSWLSGKYYLDLSSDPYSEEDYADLVRTLLGVRDAKAPPIGPPMSTIEPRNLQSGQPPRKNTQPSDPGSQSLKIARIIVEDVTHPRGDGTAGSALYAVPFALSGQAPAEWQELFVQNWNWPPEFSTMHRPGIAEAYIDRIVLNGTTIEEVKRYHRKTLKLVVEKTNTQYREWLSRQQWQRAQEGERREQHERQVRDLARDIDFD